jgi:serine/threonine protein phosphatase PrpC
MSKVAERPNATAFGAEIRGRRSEQEDSFRLRQFEDDGSWLIVLSDGMGGHAAGALASRIAAEGFLASFAALKARSAPLEEALVTALHDANDRIGHVQQAAPDAEGMGATLVAAYLGAAGVSWISVGDSPLWIWRAGRLRRLNEDHSMRGLVRHGERGAGNLLRSALGVPSIPMIDCHAAPEPVARDELVVVASDGILTLDEEQIGNYIAAHARDGLEPLATGLLEAVAGAGRNNQDNCTIVLAAPDAAALASPWARSLARGADLLNGITRFLTSRDRNGG